MYSILSGKVIQYKNIKYRIYLTGKFCPGNVFRKLRISNGLRIRFAFQKLCHSFKLTENHKTSIQDNMLSTLRSHFNISVFINLLGHFWSH